MSSILNLFSNFNDLTKTKSVTDNVSNYKANTSNSFKNSPASLQGIKFKKYQGKIVNNLEKKIKKTDLIEGFQGLDLKKNGLTEQTNDVLGKNDFASQQQTIANLKTEYQNTLKEYEDLTAKLSGNTTGYINRVNPNNPYLGKVIRFQNGILCYVTQQGVAKWISTPAIQFKIFKEKGINQESVIQTNLPWSPDYENSGAPIPTTPPLISGSRVEDGQSLDNEGSNVFVNSIVNNPINSYIGCYNNLAPSTEILFVPKMSSSNEVNGYVSNASSIYQNNNGFAGPWAAFNQDPNNFWHSEVSASTNYNGSTGEYTGTRENSYLNTSGQQITVKGETLEIYFPGVFTTAPEPILIPLIKYDIQGRQGCCGDPSGRSPNSWLVLGMDDTGWNLVDQRDNQALNFELRTYTISNPKPYKGYMFLTTSCGNPGDRTGNRNCVQIAQWNLYTSSNYVSASTPAMSNIGQMNFEQCQTSALNSGNKYFGLQAVDNNGIGNCMVSNELSGAQIYGTAYNYNMIYLWGSQTNGKNASFATLTNTGSLSVLTNDGQSIFSSDGNNANPGNYLGCYNDCSKGRGLPTILGSGKTYETCQSEAKDGNWKYFGLQFTQPNGTIECWVGNDIGQAMSMGKASNCTVLNGVNVGGSCSNAIYNNESPNSSYFLILQDDGNMCIYRGSSPDDNQGFIWETGTSGKQQTSNPNFAADKGKYGKNFIASGATLAPGEFVGSTVGSSYLIMQSDGNLCLYTTTMSDKCSVSSQAGNKTVGAQDTNALYQIQNMGNKDSIGKLAFIDQNSELHSYPSNNVKYSDAYTEYTGIDSAGYDIPGAAYGGATVEKCQTTCNSNDECAGFAFSNNVCFPKTSGMFPNGSSQINKSTNVYTRNKSPKTLPIGVPGTVTNIDSILYDNYKSGGELGNSYGLSNVTSTQKEQLSQLQSRLNLLTSEINGYTNKFNSGANSLNSQSNKNVEGLGDYLKDFGKTNNKIQNFTTNIENILKDSDITVLQKNYDYLFWSILAAGTVLVTMNIVKK